MGAVVVPVFTALAKLGAAASMGAVASGVTATSAGSLLAAGIGAGVAGAGLSAAKKMTTPPKMPTISAPTAPTVPGASGALTDPAGDSLATTEAGQAKVVAEEKKKILSGRKRRPTKVTGPLGLLEPAVVGKKSLLGE